MTSFVKSFSLALVLAVGFIDYLGIGLVYPLFSSLVFDKTSHFLPTEASYALRGFYLGLLLALMPIVQFFSAPILGSFSDHKGRRKVLIASLVLAFFAYLISVVGIHLQSLIILVFSRIFLGISGGSAAVVQASIADLTTDEDKTSAFGLYNMVLGAGFTIGPFIGGKLSDPSFFNIGSYALPFWFAVFFVFFNLIFVFFFFKETHEVNEDAHIQLGAGFKNIRKALHMQGTRVLFLCAFVFSFGWSFFFEFVPVYLIGQYNFRSPEIGNFYAYSGALYAVFCGVIIRPIVRKFSPYIIFFLALIAAGSYVLVFLLIENSFYLWMYIPFLLFLIALVFPTLTAMISNWADEKQQGETLGILQSVQSLAFAISPLFSGSLLGVYIFLPIVVGGASMLLAGVIFGFFLLSTYLMKKDK